MPSYNGPHKAARKRLQPDVDAGRAVCWRCGKPIIPGTPWHLGHDDAGRRWMGPEHERCNLQAGGRKGRAIQLAREQDAARRAPRAWETNSQSTRRTPLGWESDASRFPAPPPGVREIPDPDPDDTVTRWSRHWGGPANPRCPKCRRIGRGCPDADQKEMP